MNGSHLDVLGAQFVFMFGSNVRGSWFAVRTTVRRWPGLREHGTPNTEPSTEPEHEARSRARRSVNDEVSGS
jgi:hypothetical protein